MVKWYTQRIQNSIFGGSKPVNSKKKMIQMQTQLKLPIIQGQKQFNVLKRY